MFLLAEKCHRVWARVVEIRPCIFALQILEALRLALSRLSVHHFREEKGAHEKRVENKARRWFHVNLRPEKKRKSLVFSKKIQNCKSKIFEIFFRFYQISLPNGNCECFWIYSSWRLNEKWIVYRFWKREVSFIRFSLSILYLSLNCWQLCLHIYVFAYKSQLYISSKSKNLNKNGFTLVL